MIRNYKVFDGSVYLWTQNFFVWLKTLRTRSAVPARDQYLSGTSWRKSLYSCAWERNCWRNFVCPLPQNSFEYHSEVLHPWGTGGMVVRGQWGTEERGEESTVQRFGPSLWILRTDSARSLQQCWSIFKWVNNKYKKTKSFESRLNTEVKYSLLVQLICKF